jgi:hypothetical protein
VPPVGPGAPRSEAASQHAESGNRPEFAAPVLQPRQKAATAAANAERTTTREQVTGCLSQPASHELGGGRLPELVTEMLLAAVPEPASQ